MASVSKLLSRPPQASQACKAGAAWRAAIRQQPSVFPALGRRDDSQPCDHPAQPLLFHPAAAVGSGQQAAHAGRR